MIKGGEIITVYKYSQMKLTEHQAKDFVVIFKNSCDNGKISPQWLQWSSYKNEDLLTPLSMIRVALKDEPSDMERTTNTVHPVLAKWPAVGTNLFTPVTLAQMKKKKKKCWGLHQVLGGTVNTTNPSSYIKGLNRDA